MSTYNIVTLNIHKGFSAGNRKFTLETIRSCLRTTNANVVFLQEVVGDNEKKRQKIADWPEKDQLEYLADSVWDHFAYGKNAIYQHGHHGNAILSEIPFSQFKNTDISHYTFSKRGILHGTTDDGVHLLCLHLGLLEAERRRQIKQLTEYVNREIPSDAPLIMAGDFNDWRSKAHFHIEQELGLREAHYSLHGKLAKTFPAFMPVLAMDRVYLRGFEVKGCQVLTGKPWTGVTDHCALHCELRRAI